jgi:sialate O-acetylesterase
MTLIPVMGLRLPAIFLLVACASAASARVSVGKEFSDHMVLQRNLAVPVWGKADPGEQVTVEFREQKKTATAGGDGAWRVKLDPMEAGGPFVLTLNGGNTLSIADVLVGEVWQCGGQSNMDTRMSFYPAYAETSKTANHPQLRYYTLRQPGETPVWQVVTPSTVGKLSALGFFFGREIQRSQGVPVGLVVTAVGGTFISEWMDPASIAADPVLSKNGDASNGSMYRQWVQPVVGMAIRGTVWLQGEQDRSNGLPAYYRDRFQVLIKGWRKVWGQGDFPFYYVQLANYGSVQTSPGEEASSAAIREAQRLALSLPNTAMTVAIDIGDARDLHFPDKRNAGLRLALPAKALDYAEKGLVYSGPLFDSKTVDGARIHLRFRHVGGGLAAKGGGAPKGFAIAGADNRFEWADASLHGDTVTVSSAQVPRPTQVRYAYAGNPIGNLINREGLPASPFQTEGPQLIPAGLPAIGSARAQGRRGEWPAPAPYILFPGLFDALGRSAGTVARKAPIRDAAGRSARGTGPMFMRKAAHPQIRQ